MDTTTTDWRRQVVGVDQQVPVRDGVRVPYINMDNAASTPSLVRVRDAVDQLLIWYASVHRGTGFKSRVTTAAYEEARHILLRFLGAESGDRVAIFTKNTTESINVLAYRFFWEPDAIVLTTEMEHHANLLPWRQKVRVEYLPLDARGVVDVTQLAARLEQYQSRVKLVTLSGASNVTGYTPPIHEVARIAHHYHAEILVDAAQLAPHAPIHMLSPDDPAHLDYVVLSGHKMYAPFGTGLLVGPRHRFSQGAPFVEGGGAVKFVTRDTVEWDDPPAREEAGSPNVIGAVAMATAAKTLMAMGMDNLETHERMLDHYLIDKLRAIPGLRILGNPEAMHAERIGVVSFVIERVPAMLVAAILGYEWGIGVRAGCFCAHPYLLQLLQISDRQAERIRQELRDHDGRHVPAAVRISLGFYNTIAEVDRVVTALTRIARQENRGEYVQNPQTSEYEPRGLVEDYGWAFQF